MPNHAQPADAPVYGIRPQKPGMYLGLFHGRDSPHEAMNGWGFDGPALGPLKHVHTTYACSMNVEFTSLSGHVIFEMCQRERMEFMEVFIFGRRPRK
jgi:hypothetical protein